MPKRRADPVPEEKVDLGEYKGYPVLAVGIELPGAAGGLRDPLRTAPMLLQPGEHVFATFECDPHKFRYDPIKVDDALIGWTLVHVLNVVNATFIDEELVRDHLDEMARRVAERKEADRLAKESKEGVQRIAGVERLVADHTDGLHAEGLVDDCPRCDEEKLAAEAEALDG